MGAPRLAPPSLRPPQSPPPAHRGVRARGQLRASEDGPRQRQAAGPANGGARPGPRFFFRPSPVFFPSSPLLPSSRRSLVVVNSSKKTDVSKQGLNSIKVREERRKRREERREAAAEGSPCWHACARLSPPRHRSRQPSLPRTDAWDETRSCRGAGGLRERGSEGAASSGEKRPRLEPTKNHAPTAARLDTKHSNTHTHPSPLHRTPPSSST